MINVKYLRALLEDPRCPPLPLCANYSGAVLLDAKRWIVARVSRVVPGDADLLAAAVNALPALLDVYEAACAWRDGVGFEGEWAGLNALKEALYRARGAK